MGKENQSNEIQSRETKLKVTVLIVDDDEAVRRSLFWTLSSDYRVLEAASRAEALKLFHREAIDVVISDLHLPPHLDDISLCGLVSYVALSFSNQFSAAKPASRTPHKFTA